MNCTYCIIRARPRALGAVDKAGSKGTCPALAGATASTVATGIEISSYGHDLKDGTTLIDLLELIAREGGGDAHSPSARPSRAR